MGYGRWCPLRPEQCREWIRLYLTEERMRGYIWAGEKVVYRVQPVPRLCSEQIN